MRFMSILRIVVLAMVVAGWSALAHAQTETPRQIQALIASGQEQAALGQLSTVLQTHPDSGMAWYLTAEAQDAAGNAGAARSALAKAEQYTPGLPFAKPAEVAALQAHLQAPEAGRGFSIGPAGLLIGAAVVLFILIRLFRRRMAPGYPAVYPQRNVNPYGPGGMPYRPDGGAVMPGVGGSLLGGLAAGAGFAVGERIIGDVMGDNSGTGGYDPGPNFDPVPDRDDGLSGSPDWDSGSSDSGNSDSGGGW